MAGSQPLHTQSSSRAGLMAMTHSRSAFQILVRLVHQTRRITHITTSATPERFLRPVFFFSNTAQSVIFYSCNFTLIPVYCLIHSYRSLSQFIIIVSIHPSSTRPTIVVVVMFLLVIVDSLCLNHLQPHIFNNASLVLFTTNPDRVQGMLIVTSCIRHACP